MRAVIALGGFIVAVVLIVGAVVYVCTRQTCMATGETTGHAARFGFWTGCQLKVDGQWIPQDNWRVISK